MTDANDRLDGVREPFNVRKGPALIVVGIALFIIIFGGVIAALPGKGHSKAQSPKVVRVETGNGTSNQSSVNLVSAVAALRAIADNNAVPSDITNSLVVPVGSTVTGSQNLDGNAGQYDREITLLAPYRATTLVDCYQQELPRLGWKMSATQPNSNVNGVAGTEVLAQHRSTDGYYWEVGVIISQDTQTISPALSGSSASTSSSTMHLEILEVPDGN